MTDPLITLLILAIVAVIIAYIPFPAIVKQLAWLMIGVIALIILLRLAGVAI